MAKRLFEGNDSWGDVASRCNNEIEILLAEVLTKVEAILEGPADLRDFHYVGTNAVASFVAQLSIERRSGPDGENESLPPRNKSHYPRLDPIYSDDEADEAWEQKTGRSCSWI
jgi:hypothetical protein